MQPVLKISTDLTRQLHLSSLQQTCEQEAQQQAGPYLIRAMEVLEVLCVDI